MARKKNSPEEKATPDPGKRPDCPGDGCQGCPGCWAGNEPLSTADAETERAPEPIAPEPEKPRRISGDELKARLRQERREARLAEKGY